MDRELSVELLTISYVLIYIKLCSIKCIPLFSYHIILNIFESRTIRIIIWKPVILQLCIGLTECELIVSKPAQHCCNSFYPFVSF